MLMGALQSSESTAAVSDVTETIRHDPFAMLPFCGYHMGDYFAHWLSMEMPGRKMPKIFAVNWFRQNDRGEFLWPGYGENIRVLKWCFERIEGKAPGKKTPLGYLPIDLDLTNLSLKPGALKELITIDRDSYLKELKESKAYFAQFKEKFPEKLGGALEKMSEGFNSESA